MKNLGYLCFLIFFLLVDSKKVSSDSDPNRHIVAMPVSEIEQVAVSWFKDNDFKLYRTTVAPLKVHLEATRQNLRWIVILTAHSPLATIVSIKPVQGDHIGLIDNFWRHLDDYLQIPNTPPDGGHEAVPNVVREQLNAVVCVYKQGGSEPIQVTGFAIDTKGGIITTAHDLVVGSGVTVKLRSGREIVGRVAKLDPILDLCLIQVPEALESTLSLGKGCYTPANGQRLFALRCSAPCNDEIQQGFFEGPPRRVQGMPLWQVHMKIKPGSSGGPILDANGRLLAIVKGRYRGADAIGFLIPFETLLHFFGT